MRKIREKLYDDYLKNQDKLTDLLKLLFQRLFNKYENILSTALNTWRNNVVKIKVKTAGERVARFTENRYKTKKARKNWINISRLLDLYENNRLIYEVLKRTKRYIALKKLVDTLENRQKKNAWDDVIDGLHYLSLLKKLKYIIENWDKRQDIFLMIHYLRKWNNIAKKLKERDDTLEDALKKISVRNLVTSTDTLNDVFTVKKLLHDIPYIRAKQFYKKLNKLYDDYNKNRGRLIDLLKLLFQRLFIKFILLISLFLVSRESIELSILNN